MPTTNVADRLSHNRPVAQGSSGDFGSLSLVGAERREALLAGFREKLADWPVCEARTVAAWTETGLCTPTLMRADARAEAVLQAARDAARKARQAAAEQHRKEAALRRRDDMAANARIRLEVQTRAAQRARQRQPLLSQPARGAPSAAPLQRSLTRDALGAEKRQPQPPPTPRPMQPVARRVHFNEGPEKGGHRTLAEHSYEEYSSTRSSNSGGGVGGAAATLPRGVYETEATLPLVDTTAVGTRRRPHSNSPSLSSSSLNETAPSAGSHEDGDAAGVSVPSNVKERNADATGGGVLVFGRAKRSSSPSAFMTAASTRPYDVVPIPLHHVATPREDSRRANGPARKEEEGWQAEGVAADRTPERHARRGPHPSDDESDGPQPQDTTNAFRSTTSHSIHGSSAQGSRQTSVERGASVGSAPDFMTPPRRSATRGRAEESTIMLSPIPMGDEGVGDLSSAGSYMEG